jgi:hypothetical protein
MTGYPQTYPHDGIDYRRTEKWFFHDGSDWKKARTVYKHDGTEWRRVFGKTQTWKRFPGSNYIYGKFFVYGTDIYVFNASYDIYGDYDGIGYVAKYNGVGWTQIGTISRPYSLFVHSGSLYASCLSSPDTNLYVLSGGTWSLVENIPSKSMYPGLSFGGTLALSRHDGVDDFLHKKVAGTWQLYAFGTGAMDQPVAVFEYFIDSSVLYTGGNSGVAKWDGSTWTRLTTNTGYRFPKVYGGEILAWYSNQFYSWNGSSWDAKPTAPVGLSGSATAYHDSIVCAAGGTYEVYGLISGIWKQLGIWYAPGQYHGTVYDLVSFDEKLIAMASAGHGVWYWDGDIL